MCKHYSQSSFNFCQIFTIEYIEILVGEDVLDEVIDWFSKDIKIEDMEGRYAMSLLANPRLWNIGHCRYVKSVGIIAPKSLREKIKESLKGSVKKYD